LIELGIDTKKIFVLQSGYDENLFSKSTPINLSEKFNLPSNAKIVLYAGSFEAWKLSNFLINSARYTSNNVFFVMVGKPSAQILELVKNQNLQNKIKFVGYVSYHEIPQYLLSADVLIQYSPSSPKSGELGSFSPVKLFEYMAVGKSVLAPNLPWIKEIIVDRKNGLLFDPSSPKDLSNKIELLINDSELQKKICYQSEMDVIKYSFTERAKNMIKIINDMI
jgi:glycosyltransferase involved in cell wall biosynthesis